MKAKLSRILIKLDIVRAVAGIFHHLGAIRDDVDFDTAYATGLKLFRDVRWSDGSSRPAAVGEA